MVNLYHILEVERNATTKEIGAAYKKLALLRHPDKQGRTHKKFQELKDAHEILSDKIKRREYDLSGKGAWEKSDAGTGGASSSSVTQPRTAREYEVSTDEASTRWNRRESSRHAGSSVVPMTTGIVVLAERGHSALTLTLLLKPERIKRRS